MSTPAIQARPDDPVPDRVVAFSATCARWAAAYAERRVSLQRIADLLEAMTSLDLAVDDAQAIIAQAIEHAEAVYLAQPIDGDDYEGLTASFARLCRGADAEQARRAATAAPSPHRHRVAESTLEAAVYLVQQGDGPRFQAWLLEHTEADRAAIIAYIDSKRDSA
jgi:hypothetical protein